MLASKGPKMIDYLIFKRAQQQVTSSKDLYFRVLKKSLSKVCDTQHGLEVLTNRRIGAAPAPLQNSSYTRIEVVYKYNSDEFLSFFFNYNSSVHHSHRFTGTFLKLFRSRRATTERSYQDVRGRHTMLFFQVSLICPAFLLITV